MPSFFSPIQNLAPLSVSSVDKKWAKELYGSSAKFFFKFESSPIVDNITGRRASVIADSSAGRPYLEDGAFGKALRLRPESVVQYNTSMPTSLEEFSLGFWLMPVSVKPAVSSLSNDMVYYRLALLDKCTFERNGSDEVVAVDDDQSFVFYEECQENNNNKLLFQFIDEDGDKYDFETETYSVGEFHHFWITYNGPGSICSVYIDGKKTRLNDSEDSDIAVPVSIPVNLSIPFHINKSALGSAGLVRGNFGLIDEVLFTTECVQDGDIIARHINYGSEYAINSELSHREEVHQAFAYDDPTTIDIKSICSNGEHVYAGRSDGRLLRGDRTMWQVRRDFSNRDEIKFVRKNILGANHIVDVEDGALKIFKASVRI